MPTSNAYKIRFRDVWQRFRIYRRRGRTLRDIFIRLSPHFLVSRDLEALKGISFAMPPGECLGIIGRNGSGKSTILRLIARIFPPSSGIVEVRGHVSPLIELGAGFHSELTGRENAILAGVILGFTQREMQKKLASILAFAGMDEFADVPIRQYSTGMLSRLGFAVATEIDPDILLVDEVLAVGDKGFQQKCLERMHNFRRQGKTMLFVSHNMDDVRSICERVLLLNDGELLMDGKPDQVIVRYEELIRELGPGRPVRKRL
ncbi:MAG: ABC transporter ATP-binding protein [Candidatus Acidoferrales bacterium]